MRTPTIFVVMMMVIIVTTSNNNNYDNGDVIISYPHI